MINIDLVKFNYSQMPDAQLLHLVKTEGTVVTYEAFILLKKEFRKRNLSYSLIEEIEQKRTEINLEKINKNLKDESDRINKKLWKQIFEMKFEKASNDEIKQFLLDSEVAYEDTEKAVSEMKQVAERNLQNVKGNIKMAIYVFVFSAVILIWNYNSFVSILTIYYGIIAFFSSAVLWAKCDQLKNKYQKIIQNIDESE